MSGMDKRVRVVLALALGFTVLALFPQLAARLATNLGVLALADLNERSLVTRVGRAAPWLETATRWNPADERAWWNMGLAETMQGRDTAAVAAWRHFPASVAWLIDRGRAEAAVQRDWPAAGQWFDRAVQVTPDDAPAHYWLGRAYFAMANWDLAERELLRAAELDPADVSTQVYLSQVYAQQGDFARAEQWLLRVAEAHPDNYEVAFALGSHYRGQDNLVEAKRWLLRAAQLERGGVQARIDFVSVCLALQSPAEALPFAEQAVREAPDSGPALSALGRVRLALGEYGPAAEALRAAVVAMPGDAEAWVVLGLALEKSGDLPGARAAYTQALQLSPGLPDAQAGLDRLPRP
jgi:tetratricopeptide (TPR) repeat protein